MQQFTVPQFIDVEDKVIGPLSVRQFIILLVAGGFIAAAYKIFDFSLFLSITVFLSLLAAVFAFIKINGAPFHYFLLNIIQTMSKPRLRVWRKLPQNEEKVKEDEPLVVNAVEPPRRFSSSRLNHLALIVDTRGYYSGEDAVEGIKSSEEPTDQLLF